MKKQPDLHGGYSTAKWDIFQCGVLLFMMACTDHIVAKEVIRAAQSPPGCHRSRYQPVSQVYTNDKGWCTMWGELQMVWRNERRLFGKGEQLQTYREQCEATRDPKTRAQTNQSFWEYWERDQARCIYDVDIYAAP